LLTAAGGASAQQAEKGMRVRVKARGFSQWQVGEIHLIDSESLVLKLAEKGKPLVSFPMAAVDSVQRQRARAGRVPIAVGVTVGALAGAAIGSRVGQSLYYPDADDTVNKGYLMFIPIGAVGALVGGVIGEKKGPKAWIPVAFK
jgi:hypothetical protein